MEGYCWWGAAVARVRTRLRVDFAQRASGCTVPVTAASEIRRRWWVKWDLVAARDTPYLVRSCTPGAPSRVRYLVSALPEQMCVQRYAHRTGPPYRAGTPTRDGRLNLSCRK